MIKVSTSILYVLLLSLVGVVSSSAISLGASVTNFALQDTSKKASVADTIGNMIKALKKYKTAKDTANIAMLRQSPNVSLQQFVKGGLAGVYVQESNGEPGTEQGLIIRGVSGTMFSKKDLATIQPAVYLNGVPLTQDNSFAYDVQQYDYNRIGPATNLLSQINIDDIDQ